MVTSSKKSASAVGIANPFNLGVFPNGGIGTLCERHIGDMNRAGKEVRQPRDQPSRRILVDEQPHNATRLPTSAAYS